MKENYNTLTGAEKCAILMLSLPPDQSSKIFEKLEDVEVKEISQTMANLGKVDSSVVESLCSNFNEQLASTGAVVGSLEGTEKLLANVLPADKVKSIMEDIRGPAGRTIWDKLGNVNPEVLANFLKNEYPQTIAVVLSNIKTSHASKVMGLLPDHLSSEVVMRLLRMEPVQREVVMDIERTLRTEFMNSLASAAQPDPYEKVAEMFNFMDRATEAKFMEAVGERSEEEREKIQALMFTFDDILKFDDSGIQNLIKKADNSQLAIALKGANDELKDKFFKNMSERGGKLMKEEMEAMGPMKVKVVDEAQSSIVLVAKDMVDSGEVELASGEDDEEMVG